MTQSGFSTLGAPDVLRLLPGASAVQTIWSDTTVYAINGQGTHLVVEKVLPAGTLRAGGALEVRFEGAVSTGAGTNTLFFEWGGTNVLSLLIPAGYDNAFYMDILIAQSPTLPQQVIMAKSGTNAAPFVLTVVGAFIDVTQDVLMRLRVTQAQGPDSTHLAFAYARLLNARGPI